MTGETFLSLPEHQRAYQILCDHPSGSTRSWAARANWTQPRLLRYLGKLKELGLAEVQSFGKAGSLFRPIRCETLRYDAKRSDTPHLGELQKPRSTASRYGKAEIVFYEFAPPVIEAFNGAFAGYAEYVPILRDHSASHKAVKGWVEKGVPAADCPRHAARAGRQWNNSKSGGDYPHSLGHPFITGFVLRESRIEQRAARTEQLAFPQFTIEAVKQRVSSAPSLVRDHIPEEFRAGVAS